MKATNAALQDLENVAEDPRKAARLLNAAWNEHSADNVELRARVIAACCREASSPQLDPEAMVLYAEICSQACVWCTSHATSCKAETDILALAKCMFSMGLSFVRMQELGVLNALAESFFSFLSVTCVARTDDKETEKASCNATRAAVKLASDLTPMHATSSEATRLIATVIKGLIGIGSVAVAGGLLNMAWRATLCLVGMDALREVTRQAVNISELVVTLLSLAFGSLKQAVRGFLTEQGTPDSSSSLKERPPPLTVCKYLLVQAVNISRLYAQEAADAQTQMVAFCKQVSALLLTLDTIQPASATTISEALGPVLLGLLLGSKGGSGLVNRVRLNGGDNFENSFEDVADLLTFPENWWDTGSVAVFASLLEASKELGDDVVTELGTGLSWLLEKLTTMPVYGLLFQNKPLTWITNRKEGSALQPFYCAILQALETYALVAAASNKAWAEVESFLFLNVLHPFPVCRELVVDLWCFIARNGTEQLCKKHLEALLQLFQSLSSDPGAVEVFGRLLCKLAKAVPQPVLSWLAPLVFKEDAFATKSSATLAAVLLQMGFPVDKAAASQSMNLCGNAQGQDSIKDECRALLQKGTACSHDEVNASISRISEGVAALKGIHHWNEEEQKAVVARMPQLVSDLLALQDSCLT